MKEINKMENSKIIFDSDYIDNVIQEAFFEPDSFETTEYYVASKSYGEGQSVVNLSPIDSDGPKPPICLVFDNSNEEIVFITYAKSGRKKADKVYEFYGTDYKSIKSWLIKKKLEGNYNNMALVDYFNKILLDDLPFESYYSSTGKTSLRLYIYIDDGDVDIRLGYIELIDTNQTDNICYKILDINFEFVSDGKASIDNDADRVIEIAKAILLENELKKDEEEEFWEL